MALMGARRARYIGTDLIFVDPVTETGAQDALADRGARFIHAAAYPGHHQKTPGAPGVALCNELVEHPPGRDLRVTVKVEHGVDLDPAAARQPVETGISGRGQVIG